MEDSKIGPGSIVSIYFELYVNGNLIDRTKENEPFEFLHGRNNIVPGLEFALTGKKPGDNFVISVLPKDGYGERDENLVETISRKDFMADNPDLMLKPGQVLKLVDANKVVNSVIVREFNKEIVVFDYNPLLAGETLLYKVQVVSVREPTDAEWQAGAPASLFSKIGFVIDDDSDDNGSDEMDEDQVSDDSALKKLGNFSEIIYIEDLEN